MKSYETPDALRHDAETLTDDARTLLEATAQVADEKVSHARERLSHALESGKVAYARLQEKTLQGARATDQAIHEHPYQAALVAFGLGTLIGVLLSRRN